MKRREFSTGLISAALAAPAVVTGAPVLANDDGDGGQELDRLGRVQLSLPDRAVLVTWVLIATEAGISGLDVTQPMPQFREDRVDLGEVPLLGEVLRPTLQRRFAGATPVGDLVLYRRFLILLPQSRDRFQGRELVIAHRDMSWEPAGRTVPVRVRRLPDLVELSRRRRVGSAFEKGGEVLLVVRPSVVDDDFPG